MPRNRSLKRRSASFGRAMELEPSVAAAALAALAPGVTRDSGVRE
jgi:hypothetical protein